MASFDGLGADIAQLFAAGFQSGQDYKIKQAEFEQRKYKQQLDNERAAQEYLWKIQDRRTQKKKDELDIQQKTIDLLNSQKIKYKTRTIKDAETNSIYEEYYDEANPKETIAKVRIGDLVAPEYYTEKLGTEYKVFKRSGDKVEEVYNTSIKGSVSDREKFNLEKKKAESQLGTNLILPRAKVQAAKDQANLDSIQKQASEFVLDPKNRKLIDNILTQQGYSGIDIKAGPDGVATISAEKEGITYKYKHPKTGKVEDKNQIFNIDIAEVYPDLLQARGRAEASQGFVGDVGALLGVEPPPIQPPPEEKSNYDLSMINYDSLTQEKKDAYDWLKTAPKNKKSDDVYKILTGG